MGIDSRNFSPEGDPVGVIHPKKVSAPPHSVGLNRSRDSHLIPTIQIHSSHPTHPHEVGVDPKGTRGGRLSDHRGL